MYSKPIGLVDYMHDSNHFSSLLAAQQTGCKYYWCLGMDIANYGHAVVDYVIVLPQKPYKLSFKVAVKVA